MSLLDLAGKRGLVVRIANANSIAYGVRTRFTGLAKVAVTYLNAKAEPFRPTSRRKLARRDLRATYGSRKARGVSRACASNGAARFLLHSIASTKEDLHARVVDC